MKELLRFDLVYLATPYSKYKTGIQDAFIDAARVAARLLRAGVKAYSPITHTHPIAILGMIDPLDHSIWLPFDESMMNKSDALCVAMMDSWEISKGIAHEVDYFLTHDKPIFHLDPMNLHITAPRPR